MKKKEIIEEIEKEVIEQANNKEQLKEAQTVTNKEDNKKEVSLELDELEGVGPVIKSILESNGIHIIPDVAVANATSLHEKLAASGKSLDWCTNLVITADHYMRKTGLLNKPLIKSKELWDDEKTRKRFSTGSEGYDTFLGGGFESMAITELCGEFGVGKSQTCYSTAVVAASLGRKVIFIDTENTFSPSRIDSIAENKGLDKDTVHENISVLKPMSASIFEMYMRDLFQYVRDEKCELIIVDSIIALHKTEYQGRATLADRQQRLTEIMGTLNRIAQTNNVAVIITNQVIDNPDPFKPGTKIPAGGNAISHFSSHRLHFVKRCYDHKKNIWGATVTMEDSPRYPRTQILLELTKGGIEYREAAKG